MDSYIWPIQPKYKVVEHDKYGIRKNHYVLFTKIIFYDRISINEI